MSATEVAELGRSLREARLLAQSAGRFDPSPLFGDTDWVFDPAPGSCPDRMPRKGDRIDAVLVTARVDRIGGPIRECRRERFTSRKELELKVESYPRRLRESWGYDGFASSTDWDGGGWGGIRGQYVPLLPGPVTRQLYWNDYFGMSAKAFEAYNHDPVTWRAVQLLQEFVLGNGLQVRVKFSSGSRVGQTHDAGQKLWDDFWKRNRMDARFDMIARDDSILGEQFIRYFPAAGLPGKLVVRSLDPASIYDIITDPEDFETVYAYHQQFQTPYQLYAPSQAQPPKPEAPSPYGPAQPGQMSRYVIRQILPQDVDHYKLNCGNSERRGRSDLFPSLTWIQRLRTYLTAKVIREDMLSRIAWDLTVSGNAADVLQVRQNLFPGGRMPEPGTVFAHADGAALEAIQPGTAAGESGAVDPTLVALANMVCLGPGVPVDYVMQIMRGGTSANALVATEPAARRFADRQGMLAGIVYDMGDRVFAAGSVTDAELEVTFPPIATEDSTQVQQDLSFAEANSWVSKRTAAYRSAAVLGLKDYDFDTEQDAIAAEFEDPVMVDDPSQPPNPVTGKPAQKAKPGTGRRSVIVATNRQATKLNPAEVSSVEDEPPGMLVPIGEPGTVPPGGGSPGPGTPATGLPGQQRVPGRPLPTPASASTRGGLPASANPASSGGARAIRQSDDDPLAGVLAELTVELRRLREVRKRPDDPGFLAAAEEYRKRSAAHLAGLVRDHAGGA